MALLMLFSWVEPMKIALKSHENPLKKAWKYREFPMKKFTRFSWVFVSSCFRPQVWKANVTEKCVRNANIFPFSFPFISISVKKMIFRMNFFYYYFVLKKVILTLS